MKLRATAVAAALLAFAGVVNAAAPARELDRAALLKLADDYFAALVAHDPKRLPLAPNARFVENLKRTTPGEGQLWKTASSVPTTFKIVIPDPVSQSVGGIVVLGNGTSATQLGFRLKLQNGSIMEIEHLVQGDRDGGPLNENLKTARPAILMPVPYEYADSRGRLIHIAKSYYDALDNNNGYLAPFAADCERHENGMRTAPFGGPSLGGSGIPGQAPRPPSLLGMQDCTSQIQSGTFQYITRIWDRRVEIADPVTGLAMGFSHFQHDFTQRTFRIYNDPGRTEVTMDYAPFDMPALHVYKIWGGQIHEIEALGVLGVPHKSPSGWE